MTGFKNLLRRSYHMIRKNGSITLRSNLAILTIIMLEVNFKYFLLNSIGTRYRNTLARKYVSIKFNLFNAVKTSIHFHITVSQPTDYHDAD